MKTFNVCFAKRATQPRRILAAALVSCSALGLPGLLRAQFVDNFNDGNDDGWTQYDPIASAGLGAQNLWTFPAGGYRLQAAATPNPLLGPGRVASFRQDAVYSSFYLAADLVDWNDSFTEAVTLCARIQPNPGLGATSGYIFGYVTGAGHYVQIVRVTSERTFSITGSLPVELVLNPAKDYRFVFTGQGFDLAGRVYQLPNTDTPLVSVTASDSAYDSGTAGFLAFSLNGTTPEAVDVTFDNYYALDHIPPKLTIEYNAGFGEVTVSWPAPATGYMLQSSPVLPATEWTEVTDVGMSGNTFFHLGGASTGNKFFRLKQCPPPAL